MEHILVVEDEQHLADGLRFNLEAEGYDVTVVESGEAALESLKAVAINLVLLDVMLPGIDGFAVAAELRHQENFVPVLMLTARGRSEDVVRGFEAGADDYLPKPFDLAVLLARVKGLLRRRGWTQPPALADQISLGDLVIDFERMEIVTEGERVPLTLMETNFLKYLAQRDGQTVSRRAILEDVWGVREDTDTRAIDNFVVRLRRYIEPDPTKPKHLVTVRGVGYRFHRDPK
ncbi:MAG TPA: response regulator transcription factor [Bryobacteraceae bacterium]|jgi:DNA-binding response OmpR family regulator